MIDRTLAPTQGTSTPPTTWTGKETLLSYTIPWDDVSPVDFLERFSGTVRVYLGTESSAGTFAGAGATAVLSARGPGRFGSIRQQARQLFSRAILESSATVPPAVGPRLFGGFAFESDFEPDAFWQGFSAATFILPEYQLTQSDGSSWLTLNRLMEKIDDFGGVIREMRLNLHAIQSKTTQALNNSNHRGHQGQIAVDDLTSPEDWNRIVSDATARIHAGTLEKVVLAQSKTIKATRRINPVSMLKRLLEKYPSCYSFLIEPTPGSAFFGATPELLAEVHNARLNAMALAGSIRRGSSEEEDVALGREMMANPKERHEHALVVQAIEDNLRTLTTELEVASQPGLLRLNNVQHLKTDVRGRLGENHDTLSVVEALHPTPAVGGLPRHTALRLIAEAEPVRRGWYASPVGWIDHEENGLFVVGIRSAVSADAQARLYAGAGIVADSVPEAEWRETQLKFEPLLDALQGTLNLETS